jgi:hypothetical protein
VWSAQWILPGGLYLFNFATAISILRRLGPGTNGSAVCTYIKETVNKKLDVYYQY